MSCETYNLDNNQYDYETLIDIIYVVSLVDIVRTQKLSAEFCVKYILNKSFQFTRDEEAITLDMVLKYQPHITYIKLARAFINQTNNGINFEVYMYAHLT